VVWEGRITRLPPIPIKTGVRHFPLPSNVLKVYDLRKVSFHSLGGGPLVGITISHYKAIVKIGQGGMGEVYRHEDTNLSHEMAIKVPPEQFTQDLQPVSLEEALVVSQDRSQEKCNGA